jgi:hypothetical protein
MSAKRVWVLVAAIVAAASLATGVAVAGRPGGGGGDVDTGTVYFQTEGLTWTMNPDGSGKTTLPAGVVGEPSRALHGGHRWFLYAEVVSGHREVFAVRDDGTGEIQLTTLADVTATASVRWSPGDTTVSWIADGGGSGQEGVYTAGALFDGAGDLTGPAGQPTAATVALAGAETHDWAPDGLRMVVGDVSDSLWIATLSPTSLAPLSTAKPAGWAVWSPDGGRIAYTVQVSGGGIRTIAPSGSGDVSVVGTKNGFDILSPTWSPNATHMLHMKSGSVLGDGRCDVYRTSASGSGSVNLTSDLDTRWISGSAAQPVAWR